MVGYVEAALQEDSVLGPPQVIHGHEFHFSAEQEIAGADELVRPFLFTKLRNGQQYSAGQLRYSALLQLPAPAFCRLPRCGAAVCRPLPKLVRGSHMLPGRINNGTVCTWWQHL